MKKLLLLISFLLFASTVFAANSATQKLAFTWNVSEEEVVIGYNVYEGKSPDGPFHKVNKELIADRLNNHFKMEITEPVNEYRWYYGTAVGKNNLESDPSNKVKVLINTAPPSPVNGFAVSSE